MGRYASDTTVSSEGSRVEIERTIGRYGAKGFLYYWRDDRAVIGFEISGRTIRLQLALPDRQAREFTHTPQRGNARSANAVRAAYDQAVRQKWRALALVIKAKLEAVESGIVEFDQEFMAHIVMPDGETMSDTILPKMQQALEGRPAPLALPDYRQ